MATYTYNGHTYFLTNKTTWLEAQAEAKSLGGNLVTINDKAEQNWLTTTFGSVGRLWIGYTDQETEGVFKWISGESPTYTNWHYGEPNNNNYENNSEDYVHLYSDGTWNDLANSYYLFDIKGGIIEINNSSQNVPVNHAPTGNVTISGTAQAGQTLTANNTLADSDGLGTLNYQWLSNGNVISGATQSTYKLTANEVGKNMSVKVSYMDKANNAESVTSGTTNAVLKQANSLPTGNVTISGTAQVGQTLIASNNLFDADGLGTLNYQWLSNGNPISGATKNNYVVSTDDAGQSISVKVNYTDGKGNLENVSSSPLIIDDLPQTPPNYILWADSDYYTNRYIVVNKDGEDYYLVVNEDGESAVTFTLEISKPLKTDVTIPFRLSGTATKIKDYQGTLTETTAFTIFAGETSAHLTLTANMDTLSEKDETIILTLSNPSDGGEIIGNNDIIVIRNAFQGKNTADKWTGTKNNDIAFGNGGNDTLSGGLGDDSIDGGDGNDKITGGKGTDELTGGDGIDTFVFAKGDSFPDNVESSEINADFIVDLSKGDKIDLSSISKTFNLIKDIATDFEGSNVKLSATKFDAYIAHVYDSYYFVYETAKNGSTYEIVGIGDNEITMTFKSGIFTVV